MAVGHTISTQGWIKTSSSSPSIVSCACRTFMSASSSRSRAPERKRVATVGEGKREAQDLSDYILEIKNLSTHFATRAGVVKAVDGVSLALPKGATLALVGESGSGKSVTSLSVMRLVQPPGRVVSGEIWFDGRNLLALDDDAMRRLRGREIAMIFQDPMTSLNPVYTVGDQIAEAVQLHERMPRKQAWAKAIEMMRRVRIPDAERRAGDYPFQLSGGMRQRVMIAIVGKGN